MTGVFSREGTKKRRMTKMDNLVVERLSKFQVLQKCCWASLKSQRKDN